MEADALDGSRFKLVYLDSSQLGISESFIASARNGVRHFLAPLINEAGNSSTLMIRYFFGGLSQGRSPMDALFQARRGIHQEFRARQAGPSGCITPILSGCICCDRRVKPARPSRESLHPSSR